MTHSHARLTRARIKDGLKVAALLAALFGSIAALALLGIGVLTAAVGADLGDTFDPEIQQAKALQDRWRELRGADFTVTRYAPTEPAWDGGGPVISVLTLSDSHGEGIWDVGSFTLDGGETEWHARGDRGPEPDFAAGLGMRPNRDPRDGL